MSIYDKASLVLIPSGTKTSKVYSQKPVNGDGDFTFSRSTAATRVNADGNIEKETQNLLTQSNNFDSSDWTKINNSRTGGQSGYDGTNDAWLVSATGGGAKYILQNSTSTGVHTFSLYAKEGTTKGIRIAINGGGDHWANFNLDLGTQVGTAASVVDTEIVSIGSGWYRISVTANKTASGWGAIYPLDNSFNANYTAAGENLYIQDAQLEQGLVARDYIETTTAAVEGGITDNVPRLDYTDSSCPALLLEPQRTNIIESSEYIAHTSWSNNSSTITDNAHTSPEGVVNAAKVISNDSSSRITNAMSFTGGDNFTISAFVKKTGSGTDFDYIRFQSYNGADGFRCWFNITNGTKGTEGAFGSGVIVDSDIQDYGDGWYRISVTGNIPSSSPVFWIVPATGDNVNPVPVSSEYYLYGCQAEAGSYATSYIPTYGSSVTRVGETCDGAANASNFNDNAGVLYAEISALANDGTFRNIGVSNGTTAQAIRIYYRSNNDQITFLLGSSSGSGITTSIPSATDYIKVAAKYDTDTIKLFVNGVLRGTQSSLTMPTGLQQFDFNIANVLPFYGNTKQVLYFPTALSDAECIALTTI